MAYSSIIFESVRFAW